MAVAVRMGEAAEFPAERDPAGSALTEVIPAEGARAGNPGTADAVEGRLMERSTAAVREGRLTGTETVGAVEGRLTGTETADAVEGRLTGTETAGAVEGRLTGTAAVREGRPTERSTAAVREDRLRKEVGSERVLPRGSAVIFPEWFPRHGRSTLDFPEGTAGKGRTDSEESEELN